MQQERLIVKRDPRQMMRLMRKWPTLLGACLAVSLLVIAGALAFFSARGTGTANASTGTLGAPTLTATPESPGAGQVTLSWTASTGPTSPAVKYFVTKVGGSLNANSNCPSSAATATTALTCHDDGLASGTYNYKVTAVYQSWTATSNQASTTLAYGSLDHFAIVPSSGTETAGSPFTVTVTAQDAQNNTVADYTGTVSFTSSDAQAVLPAAYTFTTGTNKDNGSHQFSSGVTLKTAGTGLTVTVSGDAKSGAGTYMVNPSTPATVSVSSGSTQSTKINTAFSNALVALVKDAYNNPVPGTAVTFAGPSSGQSGTFATCSGGNPQVVSCVVTTNSSGLATSSTFTANGTAGAYNVSASTSGATPASFSLTNLKGDQTISFTSTAPTNAIVGGTYNVSATASSGLPVSLSIDSSATSVCTISGSSSPATVTFIATGPCTIDANQAGDSNYNAAPQAQQSVTVARGTLNDVEWVGTGTANAEWSVGNGCMILWSDISNGSPANWNVFSPPTSCNHSNLGAVAIQGTSAGWAVGSGGIVLICTANCQNPAAGATWTTSTGSGIPSTVNLTGVYAAGANTVYAVGTTTAGAGQIFMCGASCTSATLGAWTNVTPSGLTSTGLTKIDGNGTSPILAVGSSGTVLTCTSQCNTTNPVTTPPTFAKVTNVPSSAPNLNKVYVQGGSDVFVVGTTGAGAGAIWGCTGSCNSTTAGTWVPVTPSGLSSIGLNGVTASSNNAAWAVGTGGNVLFCSNACDKSGATWTDVSNDPTNQANNTVPTTANLLATTNDGSGATGNDGWAVGSGDTIIASTNIGPIGGIWGVQGSPTTNLLNDVAYVGSGTALWSVGNTCTLLWSDSANGWTGFVPAPSGCNNSNLGSVFIQGASAGWAVGSNGTLLICSANCQNPAAGATWKVSTGSGIPSGVTLTGVAASGANTVFAVGTTSTGAGQIFMCGANCTSPTAAWTDVTPGGLGSTSLTKVDVYSNNMVLVVGSGGTVVSCKANCNTTTPQTTPPVWAQPVPSNTQQSGSADGSVTQGQATASSASLFNTSANYVGYTIIDSAGKIPSGTTILSEDYTNHTVKMSKNAGGTGTTTGDTFTVSLAATLPSSIPNGAPNLSKVTIFDGNHVLAVGTTASGVGQIWGCSSNCSDETADVWTNVTPSSLNTPTPIGLNGVTGSAANQVWAVGNGGAVLFCSSNCQTSSSGWLYVSTDSSNNTNGTPPTTANLFATTNPNSNSAGWAVGANGTIIASSNITPFNGGIWGVQYP